MELPRNLPQTTSQMQHETQHSIHVAGKRNCNFMCLPFPQRKRISKHSTRSLAVSKALRESTKKSCAKNQGSDADFQSRPLVRQNVRSAAANQLAWKGHMRKIADNTTAASSVWDTVTLDYAPSAELSDSNYSFSEQHPPDQTVNFSFIVKLDTPQKKTTQDISSIIKVSEGNLHQQYSGSDICLPLSSTVNYSSDSSNHKTASGNIGVKASHYFSDISHCTCCMNDTYDIDINRQPAATTDTHDMSCKIKRTESGLKKNIKSTKDDVACLNKTFVIPDVEAFVLRSDDTFAPTTKQESEFSSETCSVSSLATGMESWRTTEAKSHDQTPLRPKKRVLKRQHGATFMNQDAGINHKETSLSNTSDLESPSTPCILDIFGDTDSTERFQQPKRRRQLVRQMKRFRESYSKHLSSKYSDLYSMGNL